MAKTQLTKNWLERANEDYQYGLASLNQGLKFYSQICFHFHQAAEKYFKAYIVNFDLTFEKIHDLMELLRICAIHNSKLNELDKNVKYLNQFYIETRYPVHWPLDYTKQKAEKAAENVKKIKEKIEKLLSN